MITSRDNGVFDNLPWEWASSQLAKREAAARFSGPKPPEEGYASPYHLLRSVVQREVCAEISQVIIENTDVLGDLVLGGTLVLIRSSQSDPCERLCFCTTDEAVGLAIATNLPLLVDSQVWDSACVVPRYTEQRGKMRIEVPAPSSVETSGKEVVSSPLPWEIRSAEELLQFSLEEKARSALAAGLELPHARDATDEVSLPPSPSEGLVIA